MWIRNMYVQYATIYHFSVGQVTCVHLCCSAESCCRCSLIKTVSVAAECTERLLYCRLVCLRSCLTADTLPWRILLCCLLSSSETICLASTDVLSLLDYGSCSLPTAGLYFSHVSCMAECAGISSDIDILKCFGQQQVHPACKNWVVRYWHFYLSGARCKWFAYSPADATATPSSLATVKSRMIYHSGVSLPRLSWKKGR